MPNEAAGPPHLKRETSATSASLENISPYQAEEMQNIDSSGVLTSHSMETLQQPEINLNTMSDAIVDVRLDFRLFITNSH